MTTVEFSTILPYVKAIKVSDGAHRQLRLISAKRGEHLYAVVDDLLNNMRVHALRHAAFRNHKYKPESCDGCEIVERFIERDKKR